eukprot:1732710-Rhodomonas_salina.1
MQWESQRWLQRQEDVLTCNTCGSQHCGECIKNCNIDNELQGANKVVSKLKNLQCIKQQSKKADKTSGTCNKG